MTASALILTLLAIPATQAQVALDAASVRGGFQGSLGQCPCMRWTMHAQLMSGQWVNRDFLVSSESLFNFRQSTDFQFHRITAQTFSIGAVEALIRGGHVGIGFNGVSWGADTDRSVSRLLTSGAYLLINLVLDGMTRLDIRSGYDFESMHLNAIVPIERHRASETLRIQWDNTDFRGFFYATALIDGEFPDLSALRGGLRLDFRPFHFDPFAASIGLDVSADHDPVRELFGLEPNNLTGLVYLDLSFAPRLPHPDGETQ